MEILASGGNLYQGSHIVTKAVAPESYTCPSLKWKPIALIKLQGKKKTKHCPTQSCVNWGKPIKIFFELHVYTSVKWG